MSELELTVERTIGAAPATVFDAWLNPDMLAKFMIPGPGMSVPKASNDPKEGGRFEITMRAGEDDIPHAGTYKEIRPHDRIVFTWESPFSVEDSTVTLTFVPSGEGTHVTLHHVWFVDQESRNKHEGGWMGILSALNDALSA